MLTNTEKYLKRKLKIGLKHVVTYDTVADSLKKAKGAKNSFELQRFQLREITCQGIYIVPDKSLELKRGSTVVHIYAHSNTV